MILSLIRTANHLLFVLTFYIFVGALFGILVQFGLATLSWASSGQFASANFFETFPYLSSKVLEAAMNFFPDLNRSLIENAWVSAVIAAFALPVVFVAGLVYGAIGGMSE